MTVPTIIKSENEKAAIAFHQQADILKKLSSLQSKVDVLQAEKMAKAMPPNILKHAAVKPFEVHMKEDYGINNMSDWDDLVSFKMENTRADSKTAMMAMSKSLQLARVSESQRKQLRESTEFKTLQKAMTSSDQSTIDKLKGEFSTMAKAVLGDSNSSGEAGSNQAWLQENLSSLALRIILTQDDCQAIQSISTAITPSINPETPVLESVGSGYGKGTLGFAEGGTANFGGNSIRSRLAKTLVQRGTRAIVTQLLQANKNKMVGYDPLTEERMDRMIERQLAINHQLIYGSELINKNGTEIQEMSGIVEQLKNSSHAATNMRDWDGKALTNANSAIDIFRDAGETLIKEGLIAGGDITGRFTTLLDYGVGNQLSKLIDDKQRIMMDYKQLAVQYGQQFSGVNTDLGVFRFRRTRTLELVQGNKWTPTAQVSKNAITWPAITPTAVATAGGGTMPDGSTKYMRLGKYYYRVSVVNDHGESIVSASFTNGVNIAANEKMVVSVPYNAAFAGGTVNGSVVSPARYFILYRGMAGEGNVDSTMYPIAKVPINGTSTTTFDDFDQKLPNHTDIIFISNNPLDVSHMNLVPVKEIPIIDPSKATSTQWMLWDVGNACNWATQRMFIVENVPGGVRI